LWPFCQAFKSPNDIFQKQYFDINRFASKNIPHKAARWRFSWISVEKIVHLTPSRFLAAILIFSLKIYFFPKNMNIFKLKSIHRMNFFYSLIFAKILKIKSQKSAILDCTAISVDFQNGLLQNFSTTYCYKMWKNFLKNLTFWMDFWPTLVSPPSWFFSSKLQRNRV
jgi:hypothetical protein